jgi:NAD(P)-dependent dehydrogenase (short-subunit alcohol dehydrogenase family)
MLPPEKSCSVERLTNTQLDHRITTIYLQSISIGQHRLRVQRDALAEQGLRMKASLSRLRGHVVADVSTESGVAKLFKETKAAYGKVDILINNAGYTHSVRWSL